MDNTTQSTDYSISKDEMEERCEREKIDFSQVYVYRPQWKESAPLVENSKVLSALVGDDIIIRDDGSIVYLDQNMGMDSIMLANAHSNGELNEDDLPWDEFIEKITCFFEHKIKI